MPHYYCMPATSTMADVAAEHMPDANDGPCAWLTNAELELVAADFARSGFHAPLLWYRNAASGGLQRALQLFAGRKVEVPTMFVGGRFDWGTYQTPGALDALRTAFATDIVPVHVVESAGHWVQQEQPHLLADTVIPFLQA